MPRIHSTVQARSPQRRPIGPGFICVLLLVGALLVQGLSLGGLPVARAATFDIPDGDVAALQAAIATPGAPQVINLAPNGFYTVTNSGYNNYYGANAFPVITREVTINGNGATIARSNVGGTPSFRFFHVDAGGKLTLNDLTLTNGNTNNSGYFGGAIFNQGGTVILNHSVLSENQRSAIHNIVWGNDPYYGSSESFTVTLLISNSTFSNNQNGGGGAIYTEANAARGTANPVQQGGSATAIVSINNSTFVGNHTSPNYGSIGGVLYSISNIGYNGVNEGIASVVVSVANSTFAGNVGANGGVLATFSGNDPNDFSFLTVTNSTFYGNQSLDGKGAAILNAAYTGAGTSTAVLHNNLFAGNTGDNCYNYVAPFSPGSQNLEYMGNSGTATCGVGSSVTVTNPLSAVGLANNGGPTKTIALSADSPAIDNGDDSVCNAAPVNGLDQRGIARPSGLKCDIGAFEAGGTSYTVRKTSDTGDGLTASSLSFALKYASTGQQIKFLLDSGNKITVSGKLPPLQSGVSIIGNCNGPGPNIIIDGTAIIGDGLKLAGGNNIRGLFIKGFSGRQLVTGGTGNLLSCLKVSRN